MYLTAIKSRGLKHDQIIFNSMEEFLPKFEKLMDQNNVKLIQSERTKVVKFV